MFVEPIHYSIYAPEMYVFLVFSLLIAFFLKIPYIYIISFILLLIIIIFYRKNTSPIDARDHVIVSPCEGKILKIIKENNYLEVVIFLNVHNIHIQYFPCNGKIYSQKHKDGEFNPAYMFEKSSLNERTETILTTKYGDIHIHQIAGLVARRIVSFHSPGDSVHKGDPMGLIKFGSQVRVKIPLTNIKHTLIKENDSISIGQVLCEMNY